MITVWVLGAIGIGLLGVWAWVRRDPPPPLPPEIENWLDGQDRS